MDNECVGIASLPARRVRADTFGPLARVSGSLAKNTDKTMPTEMQLWQVINERPSPVPREKLDLESRLEEWLCHDISLIGTDLLAIGQQIETAYGGFIDLLAVDPVGNLVILELKRDKTPRDVVAQALDYASWVQDLGHEAITEIASGFVEGNTFEQAFREQFQTDVPEILNERHRIYLVASSIDAATERIVRYLSETHDIDINVVTFAYFRTAEGEFVGRSLLLDEEEVQTRAESKSKRKPPRTLEELHQLAEQSGVADLYDRALRELRSLFDGMNRTRTNVAFVGNMGENKARKTLMGIYPDASDASRGLAVMFFIKRLIEYFGISDKELRSLLQTPAREASTYDPDRSWFLNSEQLKQLIAVLKHAKNS